MSFTQTQEAIARASVNETDQLPLLPSAAADVPSQRNSLQGVRVACFYPWVPFQPSGAWTRFTCLWRYLVGQGAEVTLAFFECGKDSQLRGVAARYLGQPTVFHNMPVVARQVLSVRPDLKQFAPTELDFLLRYEKQLYLSSPKMAPFLTDVIAGSDIVTCEYPLYAPLLSQFCRQAGKPLVVTSLDLLYELHGCHPRGKARLRELEIEAMALADALVFCSATEQAQFESFGLKGVTVLSTGDVEAIHPGNEARSRDTARAGLKIKTSHYCLFLGTDHRPNIEAVGELRVIAKAMPHLTFVIAGKCAPVGAEGNVISIGFASDHMVDLLYRGALAVVVPLLRGTGTSLKTFQAFTYGKPVVSTPAGVRGLNVTTGQNVLVADSPAGFPALIDRLLKEPQLAVDIGQQARDFALKLDFRRQFEPYGEIIRRLVPRECGEIRATRSTLLLVDNNLSDRIGHHFNYALSIKKECERQGFAFKALINLKADAEILQTLGAFPVFAKGIHEDIGRNPYPADWSNIRSTYDILVSNDCFAQELGARLDEAAPGDVVFLPNATPRQLLGLASLLVNRPLYRALRYVVLLRYSTYISVGSITDRKVVLDKSSADWCKVGLEALAKADSARCVRIATDSAELAKEYQQLGSYPVEVLPIPHTVETSEPQHIEGVPAKTPHRPRVVFLGDARDEKGFEFLPAIVRACAANPMTAKAEFVFQAYVSSHYHARMAIVIEELDQLKLPNLHLIKRPMTTPEYQTVLSSADLVLIPYDAGTYRARTSGPFVEGICANKPVVVPRDSWMSIQLGSSVAGTTFASGNAQDLVRAVISALSNLPHHAKAATELGQRFRDYHNPRRFVADLLGVTTKI